MTKAMELNDAEKATHLPLCSDNYASTEFEALPDHIQQSFDRTVAQLTPKFVHPEQLAL